MKRLTLLVSGVSLTLLLLSGCSTTVVVVQEDKSNQVDMTVELDPSSSHQMNSRVKLKGRDGRVSETISNHESGGRTVVRLSYHPGIDEPYERETLYTHPTYGESRTVEKLNGDGNPSELKSWQNAKPGDKLWLDRFAIFSLGGKLQWQEFYHGDGSVRQRSSKNAIGGLDHLVIYLSRTKLKTGYLLRDNAAGVLVERFDYKDGHQSGTPVEYHRWSASGEHCELEWRRWFDNGTLEVEMISKVRDDGKDARHYRWYRSNGTLKFTSVFVEKFTPADGCFVQEEYYRLDGKSIWEISTSDATTRTVRSFRRNGTVGMIEVINLKTCARVYTWLDASGRKTKLLEWKLVTEKSAFSGEMYQVSKLVQAEVYADGKLAARYLPLEGRTWQTGQAQLFKDGVLYERRFLNEKGHLVRQETVAPDGKTQDAVEFSPEEEEPAGIEADALTMPEWTEGELVDEKFPESALPSKRS